MVRSSGRVLLKQAWVCRCCIYDDVRLIALLGDGRSIPSPIVSDRLVVTVSKERFERADFCLFCFMSQRHGTRASTEEAVTMIHSGRLKPQILLR